MKKTALLFGVALAMGLAACDDMLPNPEPATIPELDLFSAGDLVIAQENAAPAVIDLQTLADNAQYVTLGKITEIKNFPSTFDLIFRFEASTSANFDKVVTFDVKANDDAIAAPASTINSLIYDNFTHDPSQITIYTRVAAYAQRGASEMRLGGADHYYGSYTYDFVPFKPEVKLYEDYFLMFRPIGQTAWQSLRMGKTDAGSSVYDNGQFAIKVDAPTPGIEWYVAVEKIDGDLHFNPVASEESSDKGSLVEAEAVEAASITTDIAAPYLVTIDVLSNTYTVSVAFESLYVPGGATGATNFNAALKLFTKDYVNYEGTLRLYGDVYFTAQASTDGVVYLLAKNDEDKDVEITENEGLFTTTLAPYASAGEGTKLSGVANGLYNVQFNIGTGRLAYRMINSIQIIGAFNEWNTGTAPDLTPSSRNRSWTIKGVQLSAGSEFKFCVDNAWTLSFGGETTGIVLSDGQPVEIAQNGQNFTVDAAGTYDITLDFIKQPNTVTITKK